MPHEILDRSMYTAYATKYIVALFRVEGESNNQETVRLLCTPEHCHIIPVIMTSKMASQPTGFYYTYIFSNPECSFVDDNPYEIYAFATDVCLKSSATTSSILSYVTSSKALSDIRI